MNDIGAVLQRSYHFLKQYIVPILFPVIFTPLALALPFFGQDIYFSWPNIWASITGSPFSWTVVTGFIIWAFALLKVGRRNVSGPTTLFGQTPKYKTNGIEYYLISLIISVIVLVIQPTYALQIYSNTPEILASLNIIALVLCFTLTVKGILAPAYNEITDAPKNKFFSFFYKFWCGAELHPTLLGVDIKQLTNCRIGLMAWQLLILAYFIASTKINGFDFPLGVNFLLQTIYIFKFFIWETGYFHTIDMMEDRASYYICWGCLVYVPSIYTWSTYYMVLHSPIVPDIATALFGIIGLVAIFMNYKVDVERQNFRKGLNPTATYINAFYIDHEGERKESKLLTSGYWGKARHLNYTFEIILSFAWCLPGYRLGIVVFFYPIFIVILLIHRLYRDNVRCSQKYGNYWNEYCKQVPYFLIPSVI